MVSQREDYWYGNQIENVIGFMDSLHTIDYKVQLLGLYLETGMMDSAHNCLDFLLADVTLDARSKWFYTMIVDLADSGFTLRQITSVQADSLYAIANDTNSTAMYKAKTALVIAKDSVYHYEPELWEEEEELRTLNETTVNNRSDILYLENIPNPYMEETTIKTNVTGTINVVRITDIYGKQVLLKSLKQGYNEVLISASEMAAGIYFYSIISDGSLVKTKRMCIIK